LKSPHTQNMLLRIESTGGHTHHKQVKVVCYYIEKESWKLPSQNHHVYSEVVSLPLESILSKISRYDADLSDSLVSFISSSSGYIAKIMIVDG
jgi:hypothetical protein